ncbi:MAG: hypothetical protein Q7V88_10705 [Actinomycetota bacterium]|nr:hypothetical protein [Actinomycetota bacterium]
MAGIEKFVPTHLAPADGLQAWATIGTSQPTSSIPPGLQLELVERVGDWAHVACTNGWSAWVDARLLVDLADVVREAAESTLRRLGQALKEYEKAVDDAVQHRIDQPEYQRRAFQAGLVVMGGEAWFLDLPNRRWCRYDGFTIHTLDIGRG